MRWTFIDFFISACFTVGYDCFHQLPELWLFGC